MSAAGLVRNGKFQYLGADVLVRIVFCQFVFDNIEPGIGLE